MLPVLRTLVAKGAAVNEPFGDVALLRLYQLAPDEGRARILKDIATPSRGVTLKTLGSLPARELRDLDDRLASNVESADDFEEFAIRAELLQRYASAAVAPRVLASVRDKLGTLACQPKAALLAYFLRVDPTLGAELLNAALAVRQRTGCYTSVLLDVARLYMSPVLESSAIAHLDDPSLTVAANAAEMLGAYGSAAARAPLLAAFERWHAAWAGRADEVRPRHTEPPSQAEQSMVEYRLFETLAKGRGWVAGTRDVEALRDLCVTDNCLNSAKSMLAQTDNGRIDVSVRDGDEAFVSIAQYQLESISQLEAKLALYPAGSAFHLTVTAPSPPIAAAVEERIRRAARARGIRID